MRIAHLVNPVRVGPSSDLFRAQPITFSTMVEAQAFAAARGIEVELLAVAYPEDQGLTPAEFRELPPLTRSVLDVATFRKPRKLPLLADLIDALLQSNDADVLIYTNVDIALAPQFYRVVDLLMRQGRDAALITRRTVPHPVMAGIDPADSALWASAQVGLSHPGHDCFVFRRAIAGGFDFGNTCIGARYVAKTLVINLWKAAKRLEVLKQLNVTFHLGDDRAWLNPDFSDYTEHNLRTLHGALAHHGVDNMTIERDPFLREVVPAAARPGWKEPRGLRRFLKW